MHSAKQFMKWVICLLLSLSMSACVGKSPKTAVQATVKGFMSSLTAGDIDSAMKFVDVDSDFGSNFKSSYQSADINEMFSDYHISEEAQKAYKDAIKSVMKAFYRSYSITKTEKVSDTEYKVSMSMKTVDTSASQKAYDSVFSTSNPAFNQMSAKLTKLNDSTVNQLIIDMSAIFTSFAEQLGKADTTDSTSEFIVRKVNDQWLITDATLPNIE